MKNLAHKIIGAILATMLGASVASAVPFTVTVTNSQGVGLNITWGTGAIATNYFKAPLRNNTTTAAGKAWIQFNLANTWATYGEANLTNASLTIWNANGTTRSFNISALADNSGQENWVSNGVTWTTAPANNVGTTYTATAGYFWDWTKVYSGTNIWKVAGSGGIDVSDVAYSQNAKYISTNTYTTTNLIAFLKTDTDGSVTFLADGTSANLNQSIFVGPPGFYTPDPAVGSPLLTLTFDVRVALIGGGVICGSASSGVDVSLSSSDVGMKYLLYTNGVYSGITVTGTGAAVDFGNQTTLGVYTALASNTTTTATSILPGSPTVSLGFQPGFSVQPTAFVCATNSIALFSAVGNAGGLTYSWYKNGVQLTDNGHYSGTATTQLVINPVLASDAGTSATGYYCVVSDACGDLGYSTTNALTVQVARNLVWQGTPSNSWDIATTANWTNSSGTAVVFDQGDNVILDDTALNTTLAPASTYLTPGVATFNASGLMIINGTGNIFGPASSLIVNGATPSSQLQIKTSNAFGGGTTINDGWLAISKNDSIGSGTITIGGTGNSLLEVVPGGSAGVGIPGINVIANGTVNFDASGAYAGVIVGPITGTVGKQLKLSATGASAGNNVRLYGGNFTCNCDIDLELNGANFAPYNAGGTSQTFNGVLSGNAILYPRNGSGSVILGGSNTFPATVLSQGNVGVSIDSNLGQGYSPLGLGTVTTENAGNCSIFANGGAHSVENPFAWTTLNSPANGILIFSGSNQMTWSGTIDLSASGAVSTNRTIQVNNTAPTILSGVIGDNGMACGLNKTGNGALYLNTANTYTGATTNSAGLLAGSGSVAGSVFVTATNATIGGGTAVSIGALTINGNLTLAGGGGFFRVNGASSDSVSVVGSLANTGGGSITVTNLGAALTAGQSFAIFNKAMTGGNTLSISGAGVTWTNKLAVDGSIVVGPAASTIASYSTNITYSVSGSTLTINWPTTHLGWILQNQTNSLSAGLSTNWVDVAGSSNVTSTNITVNPAYPTVFYRLRHP